MASPLKNLLERAERWPRQAQQALLDIGEELEREIGREPYDPTPEELEAIDEAMRDIDEGRFISFAELKATLESLRRG